MRPGKGGDPGIRFRDYVYIRSAHWARHALASNDSPHCEALLARLLGAIILYVASTAESLTRLRVFQHRVLVIDGVLRFEIVHIRRRPMPIQCRSYDLISHLTLRRQVDVLGMLVR